MTNPYCETLGIPVPSLEAVKDHRGATATALLTVALLERGGGMSTREVAERYERAGMKSADAAKRLLGLNRVRRPVVRSDGTFELDIHDDKLDFCLLRVGLGRCAAPAEIRPAPEASPTSVDRYLEAQAAYRAEREAMRRVLLLAIPTEDPVAVALVDVAGQKLTVFIADAVEEVRYVLSAYDFIGGLDVRRTTRSLGLEPAGRHLAELGTAIRKPVVNARRLVQGSCRIRAAFRDEQQLRRLLALRNEFNLREVVEADAKSLFALYAYGRLHGAYRWRAGSEDRMIPVRWVRRCEPTLPDILRDACERGNRLDVVAGRAPNWDDPWRDAIPCDVHADDRGSALRLVGCNGKEVRQRNVQRVRVGA